MGTHSPSSTMARSKMYYDACKATNQYTIQVCEDQCEGGYVDYTKPTQWYATFLAALIFYLGSYVVFLTVADSGISGLSGGAGISAFIIAFTQAAAAAAAYARFGRFGGLFNPANQLAEKFYGSAYSTWRGFFVAFLLVTAAAVLAMPILRGLDFSQASIDANHPKVTVGFFRGLFAEFIGALILGLLVRAPANSEDATLSLFFAVLVSIFIAFKTTGGFLNPHLYNGYFVGNAILRLIDGSSAFGLFDLTSFVVYNLGSPLGFYVAALSHGYFVQKRDVKELEDEEYKGY